MYNDVLNDPNFYKKCFSKDDKLKAYVDRWNYIYSPSEALAVFKRRCKDACRNTEKYVKEELRVKGNFDITLMIYKIKVGCATGK